MQGLTASYVLTTLVMAPATAALASLANVKDDLGLQQSDTSNDDRLTRYINEESAEIARHCNRVFGLATWQDQFRPQRGIMGEGIRGSTNPLTLRRWPLVRTPVLFTGNTHSNNTIDGIATTTGLSKGQLVSGPGIPSGTTIVFVFGNSIQISVNATQAVNAQPFSVGLSVVEVIQGNATGLTEGTDFEVDAGSQLAGDEGASRLFRLNSAGNPREWPAAQILVVYQAGYLLSDDNDSNLPLDLSKACERIVVNRWKSKDRETTLVEQTQPNLGTKRWWVGAMPGQHGPYPNDIMSVLDRYRVPVVA